MSVVFGCLTVIGNLNFESRRLFPLSNYLLVKAVTFWSEFGMSGVWHPTLLPRQHNVCDWLCASVCAWLSCPPCFWEKCCAKRKVWHFARIKSQLSNFLIRYLGMDFSFWLIFGFSLPPCCTPVCKSLVNTGCEGAIWQLSVFSSVHLFFTFSSSPFLIFLCH